MWDDHRDALLAAEQISAIRVRSVPNMEEQDRTDELADLYRRAGFDVVGGGRGDGFDRVTLEQFRADIGARKAS